MGPLKPSSAAISSAFCLFGSLAVGAALALLWERRRNDSTEGLAQNRQEQHDDTYYLQRCHALRQSLSKPRHSQFRVVCLLLLDNGDIILGANDEQAVSLGGALCAERGALLAYRTQYAGCCQPPPQIVCIYIVSDHPTTPLPPGCLCREYLYGHVTAIPDPRQTRILLQTKDVISTPHIVTLEDLYPYASVVARCRSTQECITTSVRLQPQLAAWWDTHLQLNVPDHDSIVSWVTIKQLVDRAQQTARDGSKHASGSVHPFVYGAAAAVKIKCNEQQQQKYSSIIITEHQWTAQEYGCTQDAVCQLLSAIRQYIKDNHQSSDTFGVGGNELHSKPSSVQIQAIVQVDGYGLPHAPFAPARSALVEFGFAEVPVVVATTTKTSTGSGNQEILRLQVVRAVELVPYTPELPSSFTA